MSEDTSIKESLVNAYYYLDLMYFFDLSRDRYLDVLCRDAFDHYIKLYSEDNKSNYLLTLYKVYRRISSYYVYMKPMLGIEAVGKIWYDEVNTIHNIDGIDYSDGKGTYIMGLRTDIINNLFEFNINNFKKLPFFRHTLIEHIFDTPYKMITGTSADVVRLFNQMFYFYLKTSLYIDNVSKYGLTIKMLLDSSDRAAFTFVESFLDSVGIDNLLSQGFNEPFTDVDSKRLKFILSAKTENNDVLYKSGPNMDERLEKFISYVKNDNNYINTEIYTKTIERYRNALEIRNLLTHSGHYRIDKSEAIMERKYTETFELLNLVLEVCKIIWIEIYGIEVFPCFHSFSFDEIIKKVTIDIQKELDFLKDVTKYEYLPPKEPRLRQL